jgi:hypothetical protein
MALLVAEKATTVSDELRDARDRGVDVELLLEHPEEALLPILQLLPGPWATAKLEDLQISAMSGALSE